MARQQNIPGTTTPIIQEIEDAAEEVGDLCERRMALATKERDARKVLMAAMKKAGKKMYQMQDGRVAEIVAATDEKVKVRKPKGKRGRPKKGK
jgi:fructose-1,6-bisphosphatase/sedoheptulose 1,7-bisphosphatase-like protein